MLQKTFRLFLRVILTLVIVYFISPSFVFATIDDFVISEIMYDPSGSDADKEWVEVVNKGLESTAVTTGSLSSSWRFNDGSNRTLELYQGSLTISPDQYFIITSSGDDFKAAYPDFKGTIFVSSTMSLNNTSGTLALRVGSSGNLKTIINYQSSWGGSGNGKTLEKVSLAGVNDNSNWVEGSILGGTPGVAYGVVIPTPTSVPTPTPTPTLTPTPTPTILFTPTVLPVSTVTPTPTIITRIVFSMSPNVERGQSFDISISLSSLKADTLYYIKALIGEDSSSMVDGKTLSSDDVTWLSWNGSWDKMPKVQTNSLGLATITVKSKTGDDITVGDYQLMIKVKEAQSSHFDTSAYQWIVITKPFASAASMVSPTSAAKVPVLTPSQVGKVKGSIKSLKTLENGTGIETEGLVSAPEDLLGSGIFYLDDGESGIMVKAKTAPQLLLGQRVRVSSTIEEANSERFIKTDAATIINSSQIYPVASKVRGDRVGEELEGKLITVSGRIIETSGNSFWINDGFGDMRIYIKSSTGIKLSRKKIGDYVKVTGILSQWGFTDEEKPNYRLMPRFQDDVFISSVPLGSEGGSVLGAVILPKTGVSLTDLPKAIWEEIFVPLPAAISRH